MTQTTKQVTLIEYSKEIMPLIRNILKKKELQADFKDSDEGYLEHVGYVKEAQETAKSYLETNDDYKELDEEVKAFTKELKLAVKAAAENTEYKPKDLLAYFVARNKDDAVQKAIIKGGLFATLDEELA